MNDQIIKNKVGRALAKFKVKEIILIENDACERCLVHKLAIYLGQEFRSFDVDVEYNLNVDGYRDRKRIDSDVVVPDIIIHKRRTNRKNTLVIEVKKSTASRDSIEEDYMRLKKFTEINSLEESALEYKLGLFIKIGRRGIGKIVFFKNGEEEYSYTLRETELIRTNNNARG